MTSITEGIKHLVRFHYQLVITDVSSGEIEGFQSLKKVPGLAAVPILAISPNGESGHIVRVLMVADDYLKKHVDLNVCVAKVQALLRRNTKTEITRSRRQFELLYHLAPNPERVFTREQLYKRAWKKDFPGNGNANC